MPTCRAGDRDGVEVGGHDEHVSRRGVHLRRGAAEDTGQYQGTGAQTLRGVSDDEVLGVELAGDLIQEGQALPLLGAAHDDGRVHLGQVKGVQRLAQVQHDVVGHVHGQADRAHPGGGQAFTHPRRARGSRVDPAHHAGHVAVGPGASVDRAGVGRNLDGEAALPRLRHAVGVEARVGPVRGVREDGAGGVGVLASHPAHGEAVPPVRGDVDLQDLLAQAEQRDRVRSWLRQLLAVVPVGGQPLVEHDDARVVLADAQLAGRADHAVRGVAVGLACSDGEVTRQDSAGQGDDDAVPHLEVVCPAHDAAAG